MSKRYVKDGIDSMTSEDLEQYRSILKIFIPYGLPQGVKTNNRVKNYIFRFFEEEYNNGKLPILPEIAQLMLEYIFDSAQIPFWFM